MQEILSDRIFPNSHDTATGYRFRIAQYLDRPMWVRVFDVSGKTAAEEAEFVTKVLSEADESRPAHVWGIRSAESVAKIRAFYDALGYYDAKRNRYDFDCRNVSVTFGCDISALGYGPGVPPLGSAATKAVRGALNLEILKGLRLADAPGTPGRRKRTPWEVLSELLDSGMVSPFRMGRALHFDMLDRGLVDGFSEWTFVPSVTA